MLRAGNKENGQDLNQMLHHWIVLQVQHRAEETDEVFVSSGAFKFDVKCSVCHVWQTLDEGLLSHHAAGWVAGNNEKLMQTLGGLWGS